MSQQPITTDQAFMYLAELISEYMKTLPSPIRTPVVSMVNQCTAVLVNEVKDAQTLRDKLTKLESKYAALVAEKQTGKT